MKTKNADFFFGKTMTKNAITDLRNSKKGMLPTLSRKITQNEKTASIG